MTKPDKRQNRSPARAPGPDTKAIIVDLETQRCLRHDLKLTSADIAEIDLALAIEAGLITEPNQK